MSWHRCVAAKSPHWYEVDRQECLKTLDLLEELSRPRKRLYRIFWDANAVINAHVRLMDASWRILYVAGDPKQSIYCFRGAGLSVVESKSQRREPTK